MLNNIEDVMMYASIAHKDQKMTEPTVPYLTHVFGVFLNVLEAYYNGKEKFDIDYAFKVAILHDTIEDTTTTYDDLKEKKINLIINNNAKNKFIKIDYIKIKRIFSNVITNSVKNFNGKPGAIKINVTYDKEKVRFEVADNGGGVDEKNLKKIFKPLYTTDPSRKISGLGLSICKQIISAHDGNIHAKNNSENGLSIIFYIPC